MILEALTMSSMESAYNLHDLYNVSKDWNDRETDDPSGTWEKKR